MKEARSGRPWTGWRRHVVVAAFGAALGVLLLHPITMAIYWAEFHAELAGRWASLDHFVGDRMAASFTLAMLPMTFLFAGIGATMAALYTAVDARLMRTRRVVSQLERELARDIPTLIRMGESERLEFKSSLRWDLRQEKVNKALAEVVAKTIAAIANHRGGSLLIGVADDGGVVGVEGDYATLESPDRDGFGQLVMTLVRERLGGDVCRLTHLVFSELEGHDICRVVIEPAPAPVYFSDGSQSRLFVRTGNASRELDARETILYVASRWPRTS